MKQNLKETSSVGGNALQVGGNTPTESLIFKKTFISGLVVSKNARVMMDGRERKPQYRDTRGKSPKGGRSVHVSFCVEGKKREIALSKLVASAWIDGYDPQVDRIVYIDGDSFNCHADNLRVVNPKEYARYYLDRADKAKQEKWEKAKENLDSYGFVWRQCSVCGLECTDKGLFRYNGHPINSYIRLQKRSNNKEVAHRFLMLREGAKNKRYTAAKMVASAWKIGYDPKTDYVIYKDGDCTNICADNLQIVGEKEYNRYVTRHRAKIVTDEDRYERARKVTSIVAHDSAMSLRYFDTGDLSEINKYIEKDVIPHIRHYIGIVKRQPTRLVEYLLTSCIEILYVKLDGGAPICNYRKFCEKTIDRWIKHKRFTRWMFEVPETPYSEYVRQKNQSIELLGQKFNVIRKYERKR